MTGDGQAIDEVALGWVIRQRDRDFDDWDGFEAWLSADPAHARAYHDAALADERLEEILPPPAELAPPVPARVGRRAWIGGALAASLALAVGIAAWPDARDLVPVETGPGERRVLALGAGSSVVLNGATRIAIDRNDPRYAEVTRGQALFRVRHDASRPFRVAVAGATLVDMGTVFQVTRDPGRLDVAVTEGEVVYNPQAEAVRLAAGRALSVADGGGSVAVRAVSDEATAWADGRLAYDGQPLSTVAADLTRNLGVAVTVAPALRARPVQGVFALDGGADAAVPRLAALIGLDARRDGAGWHLDEAR